MLSITPRGFYSTHLFFFNDPAPTEIYTLSLHDALPIFAGAPTACGNGRKDPNTRLRGLQSEARLFTTDRKSTRLNSSHVEISYAVFCLKKKTKGKHHPGVISANMYFRFAPQLSPPAYRP